MAIFIMATFLWVSEAVPAYATSLLILGLLIITASDSSPYFLRTQLNPESTLSYREVMGSLPRPWWYCFLEVFIAIAATKYKLDINLARILLKPIGRDYKK